MRKVIGLGILFYCICQVLIRSGYKNPDDSYFILDAADAVPGIDSTKTYKFHPSDTTPYKGNWIDVNP